MWRAQRIPDETRARVRRRAVRRPMGALLLLAGVIAWTGCRDTILGPTIGTPTNLRYTLGASGDPARPAGVLLQWDALPDADLAVYNVYSRASTSAGWDLRASTTSTSFHDRGVPDLEYRVAAESVDGTEGIPSAAVRIDERLRLEAPAFLGTTTLNGAIHLAWGDNPFRNEPNGFKQYRVYSASYDLDAGLCGATWSLEGTTIAPEFLASAMTNGVSRCFGVSAESVEGWESLWSELRADTPRPDARNVVIYPFAVNAAQSGFRFFLDGNGDGQAGAGELGIVAAGDRTDMDFWVFRDASNDVFLVPQRTGTRVALYGNAPVGDLTSIDVAPAAGYARSAIQAVPGWGYVFEMDGGDGFVRYGAVRPTHVGQQYVIFDWSYQTDRGNPELIVQGVRSDGVVVRRR